MANKPIPNFQEEQALKHRGYRLIAGIDEAGRGALAGPVVAAAVMLPADYEAPWLSRVRDSKLLSPGQREILFQDIRAASLSTGVGIISPEIIDAQNILKATRLAMEAAVAELSPVPQWLLIDYLRLPAIKLPQKGIPHGDALCLSIACASIVAKVTRDHLMVELDTAYPGYGLSRHKGYGTRSHLECLHRLGPCPIHRRTFQPVRACQRHDET
jgi:ribonuclease HII